MFSLKMAVLESTVCFYILIYSIDAEDDTTTMNNTNTEKEKESKGFEHVLDFFKTNGGDILWGVAGFVTATILFSFCHFLIKRRKQVQSGQFNVKATEPTTKKTTTKKPRVGRPPAEPPTTGAKPPTTEQQTDAQTPYKEQKQVSSVAVRTRSNKTYGYCDKKITSREKEDNSKQGSYHVVDFNRKPSTENVTVASDDDDNDLYDIGLQRMSRKQSFKDPAYATVIHLNNEKNIQTNQCKANTAKQTADADLNIYEDAKDTAFLITRDGLDSEEQEVTTRACLGSEKQEVTTRAGLDSVEQEVAHNGKTKDQTSADNKAKESIIIEEVSTVDVTEDYVNYKESMFKNPINHQVQGECCNNEQHDHNNLEQHDDNTMSNSDLDNDTQNSDNDTDVSKLTEDDKHNVQNNSEKDNGTRISNNSTDCYTDTPEKNISDNEKEVNDIVGHRVSKMSIETVEVIYLGNSDSIKDEDSGISGESDAELKDPTISSSIAINMIYEECYSLDQTI